MEWPVTVAVNARITLKSKSHRRQNGDTVTSACEDDTYLLETYETDDIIPETDANVMHLNQQSNTSPTDYVEELQNRVL